MVQSGFIHTTQKHCITFLYVLIVLLVLKAWRTEKKYEQKHILGVPGMLIYLHIQIWT